MRTALDTSVLLDIFTGDPEFGVDSREAVRSASLAGRLLICGVVAAEVRAFFATEAAFWSALATIEAEFDPLAAASAAHAGALWRRHCSRRVRTTRVIADFLVGAHALHQADALLTRDRGFFREYFSGLRVLSPALAR